MPEEQTKSRGEPILVLCHTFFNDAFRNYPVFGVDNAVDSYLNWKSATFVARFIIERQAELPEEQYVAITSQKIFDKFVEKFELEKPVARRWETLEILKNMILRIENESVNKLNEDEGIIAMADILFSRSRYNPVILVTNTPKKITELTIKFYEEPIKPKRVKESDIPFLILNTAQAESLLRYIFNDLCKLVDERMKK